MLLSEKISCFCHFGRGLLRISSGSQKSNSHLKIGLNTVQISLLTHTCGHHRKMLGQMNRITTANYSWIWFFSLVHFICKYFWILCLLHILRVKFTLNYNRMLIVSIRWRSLYLMCIAKNLRQNLRRWLTNRAPSALWVILIKFRRMIQLLRDQEAFSIRWHISV